MPRKAPSASLIGAVSLPRFRHFGSLLGRTDAVHSPTTEGCTATFGGLFS